MPMKSEYFGQPKDVNPVELLCEDGELRLYHGDLSWRGTLLGDGLPALAEKVVEWYAVGVLRVDP